MRNMQYDLFVRFPMDFESIGLQASNRYFYWEFLMLLVLGRCDTFEIGCAQEDSDAIEFGKKYGRMIDSSEHSIRYSGKVSVFVRFNLTAKYKSSDGSMKWQTLILSKKGSTVFAARNYGTEIGVFGLTDKNKTAVEQFVLLKDKAAEYSLNPAAKEL